MAIPATSYAVAPALVPSRLAGPRSDFHQGLLGGTQSLLVREALQVVGIVGEQIWAGWGTTPKTTLILGEDMEFLLALGSNVDLPDEFVATGETVAGFAVYSRPRTLPQTLRTAFPVDGIPMAVIGTWDSTEESPNEWAISLVEQWFHLLQLQRGEQSKATGLGIGESEVPSWRIDYPFPFEDEDVGNAMVLLGVALYDFGMTAPNLPRTSQRSFQGQTARAALANLRTVLRLKYEDSAYDFFRLRTWRDGVARYSGVLVARLVAAAEERKVYSSIPGFSSLAEHRSYVRVWRDGFANQVWLIRTAQLDGDRHLTSFDALGHGMAVMLDVIAPEWKEHYFEQEVWLDDLIADGLESLEDTPRATARQ